ncbi:hypothetical protein [Candidatus Lokiarchaeum ossiferum]|uniref:hypothetical protein n=1 Tax=Candidatus Lokiarchaeum ossiferum TaxID=2951803 RepID=UPI00352FAFEB
MIHNNMHHHYHHRHHRHRRHRGSPLGLLFPLVFFIVFVSGSRNALGFIFPIFILIIIISIISSVARNNSSNDYSEQRSTYGAYPNSSQSNGYAQTYQSTNHPPSQNHSCSQNNSTYKPIAVAPIKAKISCSSCDIELDSSSQQALRENGFVYCSFCGNKIVQ